MRLTKTIREEIINNSLIQSDVIKREKKLSDSIAKLAEDCRIFAFGGKSKYEDMLDTAGYIKGMLKELPEQANFTNFSLDKSQYIMVSFGGMSVYVYYNGSFCNNRYSVRTNFTDITISGFNTDYIRKISPKSKILLTPKSTFSKRFERIHQNMENLKTERNNLISKLQGALSTYTTTNNLLKDWPDMKPLIPLPPEKLVKNIPAVQIKELNKLIGLPIK